MLLCYHTQNLNIIVFKYFELERSYISGHGAACHCPEDDHLKMVYDILNLLDILKYFNIIDKFFIDVYNLELLIGSDIYYELFLDLILQGKLNIALWKLQNKSILIKNNKILSEKSIIQINKFLESNDEKDLYYYVIKNNTFYSFDDNSDEENEFDLGDYNRNLDINLLNLKNLKFQVF